MNRTFKNQLASYSKDCEIAVFILYCSSVNFVNYNAFSIDFQLQKLYGWILKCLYMIPSLVVNWVPLETTVEAHMHQTSQIQSCTVYSNSSSLQAEEYGEKLFKILTEM